MTDTPAVAVEIARGVAWLTLNRPERRNAVGPEMARALHEAAIRCADDGDIRCVVLTGAGPFFCVGGDVDLFARIGDKAEETVGALARTFHAGVLRLATMAKPLVTAINGPAAGAGLSLAILGDIAIAARSAQFTVAYSAIGLTPDGGASWLLPRLVGLRRAQEMMLTNRRVGAEEAAAMGLVTRTVTDDDLVATARETAEALALGAVGALAACRRLLHGGAIVGLADQLDAEAASIAAASGSDEGREGVAAFMDKRRPAFPGAPVA
ncbi:enoyl-CoA hydratase-related protein [Caulobacter sp. BK020]|uniref:enoyl-CoA hydratase/isomerase family protein n=1 Tax=Caulobacter sp. BK020 TaxID=2512117 RepID=UPI001049F156|nr:enoyl-CoA hydratase-related protein [Caulobacter sp. BK020]TCS15309.1 2-(1,2-epoxy-1,2-dihydrophenyl)acetyl-CoA isomerase [Caulobacter sp. BK020]